MSKPTLKVNLLPTSARGPSPTPDASNCLQIPKARPFPCRNEEPQQHNWGEEESDLIRTCGLLASSLGLCKSLSTSDIRTLEPEKLLFRSWVSEDILNGADKLDSLFPVKLEPISRSCSTWVAVGDVTSLSQLPSPQTRIGSTDSTAITAVDFVLSVNKKVRQSYIRKRLQVCYKLLKTISDKVDSPESSGIKQPDMSQLSLQGLPSPSMAPGEVLSIIRREVPQFPLPTCIGVPPGSPSPSVMTAKDVDRDRGRQLSRYERNMIIFNWLQTLGDGGSTSEGGVEPPPTAS